MVSLKYGINCPIRLFIKEREKWNVSKIKLVVADGAMNRILFFFKLSEKEGPAKQNVILVIPNPLLKYFPNISQANYDGGLYFYGDEIDQPLQDIQYQPKEKPCKKHCSKKTNKQIPSKPQMDDDKDEFIYRLKHFGIEKYLVFMNLNGEIRENGRKFISLTQEL